MSADWAVKIPENTCLQRLRKALSLCVLLVLIGSGFANAWAQPFSERGDFGAQTVGMGGSFAALYGSLDGFLTNPASLGYYTGKSAMGGGYHLLPDSSSSWNIGIVDGTNGIVGGFHFHWLDWGPSNRQTYTLGIAYQHRYLWIGASAHLMRFSGVAAGRGYHFTGTTGLLLPVYSGFSVGASVRSFWDGESDSQLPPRVHLGVAYLQPRTWRLSADASREFHTPRKDDWNYSTGVEMFLHEFFTIAGGYHWNRSQEESFWSVGGNLLAPKIDCRFAYSRTKDSGKDSYSFEATIAF